MDDEFRKTIENIIGLSEEIDKRVEKGENPQFGDRLVIEYNRLLSSLPALFSLDELLDIYSQLVDENKELQDLETANKELKEEMEEYTGIALEKMELDKKLDALSGKLDKFKERILYELKGSVSDDAYRLVEQAIESVYISLQQNKG